MNFWKFILYSGAIIITLGIISEDKEANKIVVDIIRDFEPRIIKAIKVIDAVFAEKSYFDSDKINLIISQKVSELDKQLTKIISAFKGSKEDEPNSFEDINELKERLSVLEQEISVHKNNNKKPVEDNQK